MSSYVQTQILKATLSSEMSDANSLSHSKQSTVLQVLSYSMEKKHHTEEILPW